MAWASAEPKKGAASGALPGARVPGSSRPDSQPLHQTLPSSYPSHKAPSPPPAKAEEPPQSTTGWAGPSHTPSPVLSPRAAPCTLLTAVWAVWVPLLPAAYGGSEVVPATLTRPRALLGPTAVSREEEAPAVAAVGANTQIKHSPVDLG